MIVVDSSVWIALFRKQNNAAVERLVQLAQTGPVLVGDIVLLEVLQGARDDGHAHTLELKLRQFTLVPMLSPGNAIQAAHHYRHLRSHGITIRKSADMIIATYCIIHDHRLLHTDRDFEPMVRHLGLNTI